MPATVLVTGGAGFIASHVIKELLASTDYIVRASVRNTKETTKYAHLKRLPNAESRLFFVEADLLNAESWTSAVHDCFAVFHIASPYVMTVLDAQRDLVEPAVRGTESVIRAAISANVQHIILTSSIAAITDAPEDGKTYTEEDWNTTSSLTRLPYYYSKTLAEKKAWELVASSPSTRLVVLHPAMVIGPSLTDTVNESVGYVVDPLRGKVPVVVDISWPLVDVRDVAVAHVRALERQTARGRYILVANVWSMEEVVRFYRKMFPHSKSLPRMQAPTWAMRALALLQPSGPRQYLQANLGRGKYSFSSARSKEELGAHYRPVEISLLDTVKNGLSWGFIQRSHL